jgi:uncharacterized membrane protein/mono/diheme cytochrome c family protein
MLLSITELIGHFHPVLVHLPIGILLLAALLQWLSRMDKYKMLQPAIGIALLTGMLSAVFTCISGFLLARSGEYDAVTAGRHQWLGIGTTLMAGVALYLHKKSSAITGWIIVLMVGLLIITGHLGGTLTHGEGYLTGALSGDGQSSGGTERKPIANVQEAVVYTDIIQPVLQEKCNSCHGASKQKGKLRLDTREYILLGGKNGKVLVAGKPDESELIKKISLPPGNKGHMPPKEKPQLTREEIELLRWWISSGASFDKKVKEVPQPARIKPVLAALQNGSAAATAAITFIPEIPVEKAEAGVIQQLIQRGISIVPVAQNSNYLSASFIAVDSITSKDLQLLQSINKQLIWLKLGNTGVNDEAMNEIAKLTTLTKLSLERTAVTDSGLSKLKTLVHLQYLNITGTGISDAGLLALGGLTRLSYLYLYQNKVSTGVYSRLKQQWPSALIDTGGYRVPVLASDTTEVKAKK